MHHLLTKRTIPTTHMHNPQSSTTLIRYTRTDLSAAASMNGHRDDDVSASVVSSNDDEDFSVDGEEGSRYSDMAGNPSRRNLEPGRVLDKVPEESESVGSPPAEQQQRYQPQDQPQPQPANGSNRSRLPWIFAIVVVIVLGIVGIAVAGFLVFGPNQDDPATTPPVVVDGPDQSGVPTVPTGSTTGPTPGPGVGSTPAPAVVVEPTPSPTLAPTRPSIPGGTIMPTTTIERSFTLNSFINGGQSFKCGIKENDLAGFVSRDSGNPEGFEVDLVSALTVVGDQSFTKQPLWRWPQSLEVFQQMT